MRIKLPYGKRGLWVDLPDHNTTVVEPKRAPKAQNEREILKAALRFPIGSPRLREMVCAGQKVVIVTSDGTRPCPSEKLMPPVLDELTSAGILERDITVVVALGLHRPMVEDELKALVGPEVYQRVRVLNHNATDTLCLGTTSFGTPVEIFRPVVEADLRICLGNLEFHYFAGYSGGAKAMLPGCASQVTVTANHAMMARSESQAGRLEGNPVRADLEDGAAMVGVDFILNVVVVDGEHRIVAAVAGDVTLAHRAGCAMVDERGKVAIPALADIVLVSAGGYPKDVNLYQAQKALDSAAHAVRPGGIIILVAECGEGCGNRIFEEWVTQGDTPQQLLERIQRRFVLGGHKAAAIALVTRKARVFLVSPALGHMPLAGMEDHATVDGALAAAFGALGPGATVLVLPEGGSVLPQIA